MVGDNQERLRGPHVNRLAAYEDTGLEPEEIIKMGMSWEDSKRYSGRLELKLKAYQDLGSIDQLHDMAKEIERLQSRLDDAEQCIYSIEDALDRGVDNDWARSAIAEYEETLET